MSREMDTILYSSKLERPALKDIDTASNYGTASIRDTTTRKCGSRVEAPITNPNPVTWPPERASFPERAISLLLDQSLERFYVKFVDAQRCKFFLCKKTKILKVANTFRNFYFLNGSYCELLKYKLA